MKKLTVLLLLFFLIVPSCFAYGRGITMMWQDREIAYQTQYQLDNNSLLRRDMNHVNLSVASYDHNVLIVGQVPNIKFKQYVSTIVKKIKGVKNIYNEVTIAPPISDETRYSDSWITTKIKLNFLFTSNLQSLNIKVVTENGVVYLMAKIPQSQAYLAINALKNIKGIKKIVKIFKYVI